MNSLLLWLGLLLCTLACNPGAERYENSTVLPRACKYLWQQQDKDGAWHSDTHSVLRSGQALTPFILWALLQVPDSLYNPGTAQKQAGINYLRDQVDNYGALGFADPDLFEYPNYASAYTLRVLFEFGDNRDHKRIQMLQEYLAGQQFDQSKGIYKKQLVYGGWGFGEQQLPIGQSGQVDLSHTRRVLEALVGTGFNRDSLCAKSGSFLGLLQKIPDDHRVLPNSFDGGFYYSPVVWGANKARGNGAGRFNSYPTATCDGYLALKAAGIYHSREQAALNWLRLHPSLFDWDGFQEEQEVMAWSRAMRFYHLMVRSEVYSHAQWTGDWSKQILSWLTSQQNTDGSFLNPHGAISKENDPLMCTAMAVLTATNCLMADK